MALTKNIYFPADFSSAEALEQLSKAYQAKVISPNGDERRRGRAKILGWTAPAVILLDATPGHLAQLNRLRDLHSPWCAICFLPEGPSGRNSSAAVLPHSHQDRIPSQFLKNRHIFAWLPQRAPQPIIERTLARAFEGLRAQEHSLKTHFALKRAASDLQTLNTIGISLSTERNLDALLDLILTKSREITGADAGSIYLVEDRLSDGNGGGRRHLVFRTAQNDSRPLSLQQYSVPIDDKSLAGYAALTGQILNVPDAYRVRSGPQLNREFDGLLNYRTRSVLVIPIKNQCGEPTSVMQLINAKRRPRFVLETIEDVRREVQAFSARSRDLAASLASQAGIAIENSILYRDIQRLFDGFVKASVTAIESRDPTTFGHSERVAQLAVGLAERVDRSDQPPYAGVRFTRHDLQELKYAALLHDFGKVGVREHVLVKEKKLYPGQLESILQRFRYARQTAQLENSRRKSEYLMRHGNHDFAEAFAGFDAEYQREEAQLEQFLKFILKANEPSAMSSDEAGMLGTIAGIALKDTGEEIVPLLNGEEVRLLSIPKGTLDQRERAEIESHVLHSYTFLMQIPWTKELQEIPEIVKAHHERLDGSGYPSHLKAEAIPVQARMIAISDIYDALTARDRPYKQAISAHRALDIIGSEVHSKLLDPALFQIFVEGQVYRLTEGQ